MPVLFIHRGFRLRCECTARGHVWKPLPCLEGFSHRARDHVDSRVFAKAIGICNVAHNPGERIRIGVRLEVGPSQIGPVRGTRQRDIRDPDILVPLFLQRLLFLALLV